MPHFWAQNLNFRQSSFKGAKRVNKYPPKVSTGILETTSIKYILKYCTGGT